jgi:hypothetical protein
MYRCDGSDCAGMRERSRHISGMTEKRPRRPRDPNQLAKLTVDIARGEVEDASAGAPQDRGKDPAAVSLGRRGGLKGGKARAAKLTPEERREAARKAAQARWQKSRDNP